MALRNPNLPDVPTVQLNWWSLQPNNGLYFLTCVGLYFVIPELILFRRKTVLKDLLTRKSGFLILGLALLFVLFPPPLEAHGLLTKMLRLLPNDLFKIASVYFLALLACVRFSRINLAFWALLMNCGLMMKAHQWDKYVLPLLVVGPIDAGKTIWDCPRRRFSKEMNRAMMRWHLRDPSVTSRRKIRKRTLDRRSGPAHFN